MHGITLDKTLPLQGRAGPSPNPSSFGGSFCREAHSSEDSSTHYPSGTSCGGLIAGVTAAGGRCTTAGCIESHLARLGDQLDVDGNGSVDALTDGKHHAIAAVYMPRINRTVACAVYAPPGLPSGVQGRSGGRPAIAPHA